MSNIIRPGEEDFSALARLSRPTGRRSFLKWTGASAVGLALVGCEEETRTIVEVTEGEPPPPEEFPAVTLDFSTDTGVLNYAYALEQLEYAFYVQVIATPFAGITEQEMRIFQDLNDHELVHRDFFAAALGDGAIPALEVDFSSINFASRASVLGAAQNFEDTGVTAYNGAARYLESADFLTIAGKIVSVEARHASAIRDLIQPGSGNFAPTAFDRVVSPDMVLASVQPLILNPITPTGL